MSAPAPSCRSRPTTPPTTGCTPNGAGSTPRPPSASTPRGPRGGRLIAVGTTSLRLLESAAGEDGTIHPFEGDTAIFITPGYRFRAVDGLVTNFHLPRSTLFMLVSALMGLDVMKAAYAHAIARGLSLLQLRRCEPAAAASGLMSAFDPKAGHFRPARRHPSFSLMNYSGRRPSTISARPETPLRRNARNHSGSRGLGADGQSAAELR